jgi:YD repeat-containing protein
MKLMAAIVMLTGLVYVLAGLLLTTSVLGQNTNSIPEGPAYDSQGRMIEYHYADGTQESYGYDQTWRMTKFVDRIGRVTIFRYTSNGSMVTTMPDGTTRN